QPRARGRAPGPPGRPGLRRLRAGLGHRGGPAAVPRPGRRVSDPDGSRARRGRAPDRARPEPARHLARALTARVAPPGVPRVLISPDALARRVAELGREVARDHADRPPVLVGVLKGAVVFLADLIRAIDGPLRCDFIAVASYGAATRSSGIVRLTQDLSASIEGQDVVVVEDIVDT